MSDLCPEGCKLLDESRCLCWMKSQPIQLRETVVSNRSRFLTHDACHLMREVRTRKRAAEYLARLKRSALPLAIPAIWPEGKMMTSYERTILEKWETQARPIVLAERNAAERCEDESE